MLKTHPKRRYTDLHPNEANRRHTDKHPERRQNTTSFQRKAYSEITLFTDRTISINSPEGTFHDGKFPRRPFNFDLIDIPHEVNPEPHTRGEAFQALANIFKVKPPRLAAAFGLGAETMRCLMKGGRPATYTLTLAAWALLYEAGLVDPKERLRCDWGGNRTSLTLILDKVQNQGLPENLQLPTVVDWRTTHMNNLARIRVEALMLTQDQLARAIGLSRTQISVIEADQHKFRYKTQLAVRCLLSEVGYKIPTAPMSSGIVKLNTPVDPYEDDIPI